MEKEESDLTHLVESGDVFVPEFLRKEYSKEFINGVDFFSRSIGFYHRLIYAIDVNFPILSHLITDDILKNLERYKSIYGDELLELIYKILKKHISKDFKQSPRMNRYIESTGSRIFSIFLSESKRNLI